MSSTSEREALDAAFYGSPRIRTNSSRIACNKDGWRDGYSSPVTIRGKTYDIIRTTMSPAGPEWKEGFYYHSPFDASPENELNSYWPAQWDYSAELEYKRSVGRAMMDTVNQYKMLRAMLESDDD